MGVLFSYAFRPLFLLATLHGLVAVPVWVASWLGYLPLPLSLGTPIWWHGHEMLFGFAGAAIGGFALTAVATWTKRAPLVGLPLIVLSLLWLSARGLLVMPNRAFVAAGMIADIAYGVLLAALMARELLSARNQRNYKVLVLLALLPIANLVFFVGVWQGRAWATRALMFALWVILILMNLIAGRIIPAFTRNWLTKTTEGRAMERLPAAFGHLDLVATTLLVSFAALHLVGQTSTVTAGLGLGTATLFLARWIRWQGYRAVREPIVWVLHVAFLWIPIGVALLSATELGIAPRNAGVHALTSGAIATMIVAVASRASLGHTARPLRATRVVTAAYVLITLSALLRVLAALGIAPTDLLIASALAWLAGFSCFAWRYLPVLSRPAPERSLPIV